MEQQEQRERAGITAQEQPVAAHRQAPTAVDLLCGRASVESGPESKPDQVVVAWRDRLPASPQPAQAAAAAEAPRLSPWAEVPEALQPAFQALRGGFESPTDSELDLLIGGVLPGQPPPAVASRPSPTPPLFQSAPSNSIPPPTPMLISRQPAVAPPLSQQPRRPFGVSYSPAPWRYGARIGGGHQQPPSGGRGLDPLD